MSLASRSRKWKVLVVDPSSSVRVSIWMILKDEYEVLTSSDLQEALGIAEREEVDLLLVGVDLPFFFYGPFFKTLRKTQPRLPLLLLLGEKATWGKGVDISCSDWLSKPFSVQALREKVQALVVEKEWLEKSGGVFLSVEERVKSWLYSSRVTAAVRERVFRVSSAMLPVLIIGEEGTGRGGVAKGVHYLGPWKDRPFLRFFCRGLTVEGFVQKVLLWVGGRGVGEGVGLTVYLEGVESLGWEMQGLVLDMLREQRVVWPGVEEVRLEVQVLSSSASSLVGEVSGGRFRGDLAQVLGVLPVELKPLRERREDIPGMVREVLEERGIRKKVSVEAMGLLQEYYWPGNLGELEGVVLRSAVLGEGEVLGVGDLDFGFTVGEGKGETGEKGGKSETGGKGGKGGKGGEGETGETGRESERGEGGIEGVGVVLDRALSALAHEIKNPLVAISTFAHLLPEKYEDAEFRDQFSRLVGMDVRRINEVLERLLEYGQFREPGLRGNDLNLAVGEVLREKRKELDGVGVQVESELRGDLPLVLFDGDQLGFVLRNVLEEAVGGVGGKRLRLVTGLVEGEGGEKGVELRVWYDGGEGVLRSLQRAVWPEGELGFEDWGLAMELVRKVMGRNRGEMQMSQEEGGGTTITLHFSIAG